MAERHEQVTWVKVFKNGPSKICERQPLKQFKWYGLRKQPGSLKWTSSGKLFTQFYFFNITQFTIKKWELLGYKISYNFTPYYLKSFYTFSVSEVSYLYAVRRNFQKQDVLLQFKKWTYSLEKYLNRFYFAHYFIILQSTSYCCRYFRIVVKVRFW